MLVFPRAGVVFGVHEDVEAADIAMKDIDIVDQSAVYCVLSLVISRSKFEEEILAFQDVIRRH